MVYEYRTVQNDLNLKILLTKKDDDADKDGDDGASAQARRCYGTVCSAVTMFVTRTHLHLND